MYSWMPTSISKSLISGFQVYWVGLIVRVKWKQSAGPLGTTPPKSWRKKLIAGLQSIFLIVEYFYFSLFMDTHLSIKQLTAANIIKTLSTVSTTNFGMNTKSAKQSPSRQNSKTFSIFYLAPTPKIGPRSQKYSRTLGWKDRQFLFHK